MIRFLLACTAASTPDTGSAEPTDFAVTGPHPVGRRTIEVADGSRLVDVEIWYPATEAGAGGAVLDLVPDSYRDAYAALLAKSPAGCATQQLTATLDAPPLDGPLPVVLSSHCYTCTRFSKATVAEHLASHGFAVLAPGHTGNTLWDLLDGDGGSVDSETLDVRVADMRRLADLVSDGGDGIAYDTGAVGLLGHSFGAVTAGKTLIDDDGTLRSGMFIGAPVDSPLLPGVDAEFLTEPTLFMLLEEDGSITQLGNELIRTNSEQVTGPTRLVELADAGHWSVSDLCGVHDSFLDGCGEFISPERGRDLAAAVAAAFFAETLSGDADGTAWLATHGQAELTVSVP